MRTGSTIFPFSLKTKITIMIMIIVGFCLLLNLILNYFNFEKSYTDIVYSRFSVIAAELKDTAENCLNLGLSLSESKNIQIAVDSIMEEQNDIASIMFFDDAFNVLFARHQSKLGADILQNWKKKMGKAAMPQEHYFSDNGYFIIAVPIVNAFNIKIGALAVGFPQALIKEPSGRMLRFLIKIFAVLFVFCFCITFVTTALFFKKITAAFTRMGTSLEELIKNGLSRLSPADAVNDLEDYSFTFQEKSAEVLQSIEAIDKKL